MWPPPLQGKSQQGQSDACHQLGLLPQLDLQNRILSVHLPSQCQRPAQHSLGESQGGASSAALLPETSLLTVLMYRVRALPVTLLRCSVGPFLVPYLSCFFSPSVLAHRPLEVVMPIGALESCIGTLARNCRSAVRWRDARPRNVSIRLHHEGLESSPVRPGRGRPTLHRPCLPPT